MATDRRIIVSPSNCSKYGKDFTLLVSLENANEARRVPRKVRKFGGAEGNRTPDLMTASHALSQLSYGPKGVKLQRVKRWPRIARTDFAVKLPCLLANTLALLCANSVGRLNIPSGLTQTAAAHRSDEPLLITERIASRRSEKRLLLVGDANLHRHPTDYVVSRVSLDNIHINHVSHPGVGRDLKF